MDGVGAIFGSCCAQGCAWHKCMGCRCARILGGAKSDFCCNDQHFRVPMNESRCRTRGHGGWGTPSASMRSWHGMAMVGKSRCAQTRGVRITRTDKR